MSQATEISPLLRTKLHRPRLAGPVWLWQQTMINNGDQFTPDKPGHYTLQFKPDGTLAAQADCNQVSGSYTLDGSQLTIELGPSRLAACPERSLGDQFVANLSGANSYFFDGDDLLIDLGVTKMSRKAPQAGGLGGCPPNFSPLSNSFWSHPIDLMFDSGTMRFSPQSNELAGTSRGVIGHNHGWGGVVSTMIGTELAAAFGQDGTLSGSAGCNSYSAGYEVEGDTISIGLPISTKMACAEPEGIMEQEYLTALGTAAPSKLPATDWKCGRSKALR